MANDRPVPLHALAGGLIGEYPGFPAGRHAVSTADHSHVHSLVLLGLSREGAWRCWVPLTMIKTIHIRLEEYSHAKDISVRVGFKDGSPLVEGSAEGDEKS